MKAQNITLFKPAWLFVLALYLFSCSKDDKNKVIGEQPPTNILLIIADDLGKDATTCFSQGAIKPKTPNLNQFCFNGGIFDNFWVNPSSASTRACILTGKYGYRTGVKEDGDVLSTSETVIQKYIKEKTNNQYATAVIGKWDVSGNTSNFNPEVFGIDYFSGILYGNVPDYYNWQLSEDGVTTTQTTYVTEKLTDLAIDWINKQDKPWFLWLAYNAPHTPYHIPPDKMHSQGALPPYTPGIDPFRHYMAAIEAMDFQIGRLLESLPPEKRKNTTIIFIGDNGTPGEVVQSPYNGTKTKNTLYEGGINVPMYVSGYEIRANGGRITYWAKATDLFATIARMAGIYVKDVHDGRSFYPKIAENQLVDQSILYSEMKKGASEQWAVSNNWYKLIKGNFPGSEEMYNLRIDPLETNNLLIGPLNQTNQDIKKLLEDELEKIRK